MSKNTSMSKNNSILNAAVRLDKLPVLGRELKVAADKAQLLEIARAIKVSEVGRFSADIRVSSIKGGVQVTGQLRAEISQPCVISLEPVHQRIDEPLNRVFMPQPQANAELTPDTENYVDLGEDDLPDYYLGPELNLNAYLLEALGLAVDLYPKVTGVTMSADMEGDNPEQLSPFAILKTLGKDQ